MPRLVWVVSEVIPGKSWTWVQHSPGGATTARHDVGANAEGGTLVSQELHQRGVIGSLVGLLMRRMTKRYLAMEAQGLKARSEHHRSVSGPNP